MQKRHLFFAGAFLCLLAAGWGFYKSQKPRGKAGHMSAAFTMTAEQLYKEYSTNENAANEKYTNKIIAVTGVVTDVQTTAHATNILLSSGAATAGVNCSFQKRETGIAIGEQVTLKGRCTGFLMDVNLVDAVQISN